MSKVLCKNKNNKHLDFGLKTNHEFSTHSDLKVINSAHSIVGMYLSSGTSVWLAKVSYSISTNRTIISERLYCDFILFLHDSFSHPEHQCFVGCFLDSLWIWHMVNKCDWQGLLCFHKMISFLFLLLLRGNVVYLLRKGLLHTYYLSVVAFDVSLKQNNNGEQDEIESVPMAFLSELKKKMLPQIESF